MAMFHFHADQIKRSAGRTAVAAAAYRAGEQKAAEPKKESVLKMLEEPVPEKPKAERSSGGQRIKPESERRSLRASLQKHQQEVDEREANRTARSTVWSTTGSAT